MVVFCPTVGKIRLDFKISDIERASDSFLLEDVSVDDEYSNFKCSKNVVLPALSSPRINILYCSLWYIVCTTKKLDETW